MFAYSDPTGTGRLQQEGDALFAYRRMLHALYVDFARFPNSAFTLLDAFEGISAAEKRVDTIAWKAFPLTSQLSAAQIDANRFSDQDEYVEWQVEKQGNAVRRITFTTEFPEYFEALAEESIDALIHGIWDLYPNANPNVSELFGPGVNPNGLTPDARAAFFRSRMRRNPWNDGTRGILCLGQGANTLGALFNLVGQCAVPNTDVEPADMCDAVQASGACGPGRASDPAVCAAAQTLSRAPRALSMADQAGIRIISLGGIWKINGQAVDINDPQANGGAWKVSRNGRRGVLDVSGGLTQGDDPIVTGAQVARVLTVGADVLSAPDELVPPWAKLGQESSRVIS